MRLLHRPRDRQLFESLKKDLNAEQWVVDIAEQLVNADPRPRAGAFKRPTQTRA